MTNPQCLKDLTIDMLVRHFREIDRVIAEGLVFETGDRVYNLRDRQKKELEELRKP